MSVLGRALRDALAAHRGGRLSFGELAPWASDQVRAFFDDPAHRYSYREDVALEALGILAAAEDAPEPELEVDAAAALVRGDVPFRASRLLLLDPEWVDTASCAPAAALVREAGARLERGGDWQPVLARLAGPLSAAVEPLEGDDYAQLVVLEAASIGEDLKLAVNGTIEVLGRGRPRLDGSLLADRLVALAQVLRGERPLRALVRGRGLDDVQVVLSY